MHDFHHALTRLRKRLGKRRGKSRQGPRPLPLPPGEVAGSQSHLQYLLARHSPITPPSQGHVVVVEAGKVGLAVEGCMAIPGGGIALRGWLADPDSQIAGLWLEIDATLRPAHIASRMYRQDVLEQRGLLEAFPGHRAGYYMFEPCDVQLDRDVEVKLHAVVRTPQGFVVLTSGVLATPGHRCSLDRLTQEFRAGFADPATIAAAAEPFFKGLALANRKVAWRERRHAIADGKPADLAVVIVVNENVEMLHHVLAALEGSRNAGRTEVILTLQSPSIERDVNACVHNWHLGSPFATIKTLVPIVPVGFGLAASGGIDLAQSPAIALTFDEILPPIGDWIEIALDMLSQDSRCVLVPPITTFDHRPFSFSNAFDAAWAEFENDHSALADVTALTSVRNSLALSCGFLCARREVIETAGGLDHSLPAMDICLLEFMLRLQSDPTVRLAPLPRDFTHLRLPVHTAANAAQHLWSLYALASHVRRRHEEVRQSEPQKAAVRKPRLERSLSAA